MTEEELKAKFPAVQITREGNTGEAIRFTVELDGERRMWMMRDRPVDQDHLWRRMDHWLGRVVRMKARLAEVEERRKHG